MSENGDAEWVAHEAGWAWRDVELPPDEQDSVETQLPENATDNLSTVDFLKTVIWKTGKCTFKWLFVAL